MFPVSAEVILYSGHVGFSFQAGAALQKKHLDPHHDLTYYLHIQACDYTCVMRQKKKGSGSHQSWTTTGRAPHAETQAGFQADNQNWEKCERFDLTGGLIDSSNEVNLECVYFQNFIPFRFFFDLFLAAVHNVVCVSGIENQIEWVKTQWSSDMLAQGITTAVLPTASNTPSSTN